jgi:ribonuclease Z
MFDAGDLSGLSTRELLRVSHLFVTHAHMDHFIDFTRLVRVHLHRTELLNVYGPHGFIDRVAGALSGFTWNVSQDYPLAIVAWEVGNRAVHKAYFRASTGFALERLGPRPNNGILLDEEALRVSALELDHGIPCLGYRLEEKERVNIMAGTLEEAGLAAGPWLTELKKMVLAGEPPERKIMIARGDDTEERSLGQLADLYTVTRGRVLAYVVDAAHNGSNTEKIKNLAQNTDLLYIEAAFASSDSETAAIKNHLTAAQAGELAALAGAGTMRIMHLSPRYEGREQELIDDASRGVAMVSGSSTVVQPGWRNQ